MKIRIVLTVSIILFLIVLGTLGESLINISTVAMKTHGFECPKPTGIVLAIFDVNGGTFSLSMTPFMILFVGIANLIKKDKKGTTDYLYAFVFLCLLVMIYFTMFSWALSVPFFVLGKGSSHFRSIILFVDFIIIAGVVFMFIRKARKQVNNGNVND